MRVLFLGPGGHKPVKLISRILNLIDTKESTIVDFFSGSATSAEAVMRTNLVDEGSRRFILVQLPEKCDNGSVGAELGYNNLCEIGEERIRRAGEKIKSEIEAENAQLTLDGTPKKVPDIGFRVLRVDDSNYEDRRKNVGSYSQADLDFDVDITKSDRSNLDLLFEALPKFQLPYDVRINTLSGDEFDGHTVYSVDDGRLLACFEADIPESPSTVFQTARRAQTSSKSSNSPPIQRPVARSLTSSEAADYAIPIFSIPVPDRCRRRGMRRVRRATVAGRRLLHPRRRYSQARLP